MKKFITSKFRSFSLPSPRNESQQLEISKSKVSAITVQDHNTTTTKVNAIYLPEPSSSDSLSSMSESLTESCSIASASSSTSLELMDSQTSLSDSTRRYKILVELVSNEATYTGCLWRMLTFYKAPLKSILTESEISSIFCISDLLYDFHQSLLTGLTQRLESQTKDVLIGEFLLQMVSFLRCYSAYVNNYSSAIETMSRLEERRHFQMLLHSIQNSVMEDGTKIHSLYSYLIMPIQRIPRYLLLLQDLQLHTPQDHPDAQNLHQAIAAISEIAIYIDIKKNAFDQSQRLTALSMAISHLPADAMVMRPGRALIWEGSLFSKDRDREVYVFLLTDALIITKLTKSRGSRCSRSSSLIMDSPSHSPSRSSTSSGSWIPSFASSNHSEKIPTYRYLDHFCFQNPHNIVVSNYGEQLLGISMLEAEPTAARTVLLQQTWIAQNDVVHGASLGLHNQTQDFLAALCGVLNITRPPIIDKDFSPPTLLLNQESRISPTRANPTLPRTRSSLSKTTELRSRVSSITLGATADSGRCRSLSMTSEKSALSQRSTSRELFPPPVSTSLFQSTELSHATKVLAGFIPADTAEYSASVLKWHDIERGSGSLPGQSTIPGTYPVLIKSTAGYHSEIGSTASNFPLVSPQFSFPETEIPFYRTHFVGHEHIHLFATLADGSNPVIVSIEAVQALPFRRVILRSIHGELRTVIPLLVGPFGFEFEPFRSHLEQSFPAILPHGLKWSKHFPNDLSNHPFHGKLGHESITLCETICRYDDCQQRQFDHFKVGVVLTKPGNMVSGSDQSVYSIASTTPDFMEFLQFLGEEVSLLGYQGYSGGLDTANNRTGTHALKTTFKSDCKTHEILFHVNTLLPHSESDNQQLAKKRHIGNDVVVVVFHQDDAPFDPKIFVSKFNHIFIVIKKVGTCPLQAKPLYQMALTCKDSIPPCHPLLPETPIFVADESFHRFLLAKIINAEAVASNYSQVFLSRIQRSRNDMLKEIIMAYSKTA